MERPLLYLDMKSLIHNIVHIARARKKKFLAMRPLVLRPTLTVQNGLSIQIHTVRPIRPVTVIKNRVLLHV